MFTMSPEALTVGQAETYYQEKYARDDYYTEGRTVAGQWFGRGALALGLSGEASVKDFRGLLRGLNPRTGEELVTAADHNGTHRAGWDGSFIAPKSLSIQSLAASDTRLIEAHRAAVETTLGQLEEYALTRRRGGSEWVVTGNLVTARFEHIAARPAEGAPDGQGPDPHLHTHVVFLNATRRADDAWRAWIQSRSTAHKPGRPPFIAQSLQTRCRSLATGSRPAPEMEAGRSPATAASM